jgi:hypothetical protein
MTAATDQSLEKSCTRADVALLLGRCVQPKNLENLPLLLPAHVAGMMIRDDEAFLF